MKLQRGEFGTIPANYPKTFYRLTNWMTGAFIDDYDNQAEAHAASFASKNGTQYDHKVSTMHLTGN